MYSLFVGFLIPLFLVSFFLIHSILLLIFS